MLNLLAYLTAFVSGHPTPANENRQSRSQKFISERSCFSPVLSVPSLPFLFFSPLFLSPRSGPSNRALGSAVSCPAAGLKERHLQPPDSLGSKYTKIRLRPNPPQTHFWCTSSSPAGDLLAPCFFYARPCPAHAYKHDRTRRKLELLV